MFRYVSIYPKLNRAAPFASQPAIPTNQVLRCIKWDGHPTVQHQGNPKFEWFTTIDCPITRKYIEMQFWSTTFLFLLGGTPRTRLIYVFPTFYLEPHKTSNIIKQSKPHPHLAPSGPIFIAFWAPDGPGWPRQTVSAGNTPSGSSLDGAHHRLRPHRGPEANFDPRFVADAGLRLPQVSLVPNAGIKMGQDGTSTLQNLKLGVQQSFLGFSWFRSACSKLSGTASTHCQGQLDEAMNTIHLQFWAMPTKLLSRRLLSANLAVSLCHSCAAAK